MPDNYDAGAPESGVPESETPQEPDRGYVPNPQGGVVREPAPQMRVFVDKNGQVQRVNPIQVPDAVSAGWQETDPETAAKITKFSLNPAQQKLMHDSPVTAGALSFTGNAIPGGRQLLSATTGISPEQQDLLAAENPNASRIGGIAGSLSQAAITLGLTGSPAVMGGIGGGTEALNHEGLTGQINPGEILDKAGAGAVTGELTSAAMPPEEMALPGTQIEQPAEMAKWQQDIQDRLNQTAATKQAVIDSTQKNKSVINEQLNDLMAKHVAEKTASDASGQKLIKVMQAQNEDARLNWPSMKAKIMQNFASNLPSSVTPEMRQKIIAMQSQLLDNGFNSKMAEKELGANHAADSLSRAADAKYGPQIQEQIKQLELEDSLHKTRTEGLDHYTRSLNQQMQSTKQKLPGMAEGGVIGDNGEIKQLGQPDEVAPGVAPPNEMALGNIPYNAESIAFHHGLAPILGIEGKSKFKMDEPQSYGETAPDKFSMIRTTAGKTARHVTKSIKDLMGDEQPEYEHEEPAEDHAEKSIQESKLLTGLSQTPEGEIARIAENTNDIGMNAPVHAGMLGAVAVRARQVLDSMKPKNPAPSLFGKDDWKPSEADLLNYDQVKAAVLDPKSVFRDANEGTLTDIGWKAFAHVYPTIANDYSQELIRHSVEKRGPETLNQKYVFGLVTGITSPEFAPDNVAFLQSTFAPTIPQAPPSGKVRAKGADELDVDKSTANPTEASQLKD